MDTTLFSQVLLHIKTQTKALNFSLNEQPSKLVEMEKIGNIYSSSSEDDSNAIYPEAA